MSMCPSKTVVFKAKMKVGKTVSEIKVAENESLVPFLNSFNRNSSFDGNLKQNRENWMKLDPVNFQNYSIPESPKKSLLPFQKRYSTFF